MSGKVSSMVLVMAVVICGLTVMVHGFGDMTEEQKAKLFEQISKAKCNVTMNKTAEAIIFANCVTEKTGKVIAENDRENPATYKNLDLTPTQWKEVKNCSCQAHGFEANWTLEMALKFAEKNMTYDNKETEDLFASELKECGSKFEANTKDFTQCGKEVYFKVCLNMTDPESLKSQM